MFKLESSFGIVNIYYDDTPCDVEILGDSILEIDEKVYEYFNKNKKLPSIRIRGY